MLAFCYTHSRSGAHVEIRQAVRVPRDLPFELRICARVALLCWGVMPDAAASGVASPDLLAVLG